MRFVIVGPGSLGCWLAARLAEAGHEVQLVHRDAARAAALAAAGVTLRDGGAEVRFDLPVVAAEAAWPEADLTVFATKAYDVAPAAAGLRAATAMGIQNGLGSERALAGRFGEANVLVGVARTAAFREAPGVVQLVRSLPTTVGRLDRRPMTDAQRAALAAMDAAGIPIEIAADIRPAQWGKLLINASMNPVAAMLDVPNGRLVELPAAVELMGGLAAETAAVAAALDIRPPFADPAAEVQRVCRETAGNINSMLADLRAGRPTEIDFINAAVCRAAEPAAIDTPLNRTAWRLVKAKEARNTPV